MAGRCRAAVDWARRMCNHGEGISQERLLRSIVQFPPSRKFTATLRVLSQSVNDAQDWLETESDPLSTARGVLVGAALGALGWAALIGVLLLCSCAPGEKLGCLSQELARSGATESVIAAMGGCE